MAVASHVIDTTFRGSPVKKLLALLAVGGLAGAGAMFAPASADSCLSEAGLGNEAVFDACGDSDGQTGHGKIDGNDDNEGPAGGYISYSNDGGYENDGLCISDNGDPEAEVDEDGNDTDPDDNGACDEEIPDAVVAYATS